MNTNDVVDFAMHAVFSLGFLALQLALLWDVTGGHAL